MKHREGPFWIFIVIILQIIFATSVIVISKYLFINSGISPFFLLFLRYFFSFILLFPIVFPIFISTYKSHNFGLSFRRAFINILALALWSYGYSHIPLSVASTFNFATPVITILIAEIYLKEKITKLHRFTLFLSIMGIFIALRPNIQEFNVYYIILFLSTILWSFSNITRKIASAKANLTTWMCYYSFWSIILTSIFAIPFFSKIPLQIIPIIIILAIFTSLSNILSFYIYKKSEASFVQSFDFLRLVFVSIADIAIFHNSVSVYIFIGSFLIITSSAFVLFNEKKKIKRKQLLAVRLGHPVIKKTRQQDLDIY